MEPLLKDDDPASGSPNAFAVESRRWFVLFVYFVVGTQQGLVWITFNANPKEVTNYYHISNASDDGTLPLLLN